MTTITLEVSDELAAQFKVDPADLPAVLQEAVQAKLAALEPGGGSAGAQRPLPHEIINFLSSAPGLEQMVDFKISAPAQERLENLLERNREDGLMPEEKEELEKYLQLRHIMVLLKASARRVLGQRPQP
jgi:hypothetical protein